MWLKAWSAYELRNYGYAVQLVQGVLREVPDFLPGRQLARKAAAAKTAGKKAILGGLSGTSFSTMKVSALLKKDPKAALDAVEKILENDPFNAQANQMLRDAALAFDMPETAAFALETIIEGAPKDTKVMHELATHYMSHDQPEKGGEVFARIVAVTPNDLVAIKGSKDAAARASMRKGGWETAETYRDLIKDKETAIQLEQQNRVVKDLGTIDNLLADLLGKAEGNVDASRRIGELYEQKDDLDSAIQWYEYAAQLLNNSDANLVRKVSEIRLKQIDLCIQSREEYIAATGADSEESVAYAQELVELRQQRAEMEVDGARLRVERNPTDLVARFELGEILLAAGNPEAAIPELQQAKKNPSVRLRAMNLLARCFVAKGMLDLAAKTFAEAASEIITMDSTKKDIVYNLALVHERMGQKEKYLEAMKEIYEVDYGYLDVASRVESSY